MKLINVVFFIIILQFIYPGLVRYIGFPELPSLFIEILVFCLFLTVLFINQNKIVLNRYFNRQIILILLLVLIAATSSIINSSRITLFIKSLIEFNLIYIFLFLSITIMDSSEKQQIRLIRLIYFLIFLQIPVTLLQYFFERTITADSISGTISISPTSGGTGINAVLAAMLLSVIVTRIIVDGYRVIYVLLILCTFVPSLMGGSKLGFILIPISLSSVIFSILYVNGKLRISQTIYLSLTTIVLILGIYITFDKIAPQSKYANYIRKIEFFTSMEKMIEYGSSGSSEINRINAYAKLYEDKFTSYNNLLFGLGTASFTKSSSLSMSKSKLENFRNLPDSIKIIGGLGVLGICIILAMLLNNMFIVKQYIEYETSKFMIVNGYALIPLTIVFILSLFYTSSWASQIGMIYWIFAGVIMKRFIISQKWADFFHKYPNAIS